MQPRLRMTRNQRIRKLLVERRTSLLARHRDGVERVEEELDTREIEDIDRSAEHWDARVMSTLGDSEVRELARITAAIRRIDGGTFGLCELCERKIESARLDAVPTTTTCIDCAMDLAATEQFRAVS